MPAERRFVPDRGFSFRTLNVIPTHVALVARCRCCGVERELDRRVLGAASRRSDVINDIEARLVCSACGAHDAEIVTGYFTGEGD